MFLEEFLEDNTGGSGGASIAEDMYFNSIAARNAFTTTHPNRIYQGVTCAVTNASAYDYYQYDMATTSWLDANLIFQGQRGEAGKDGKDGDGADLIDDTSSATDTTFSSSKINDLFQTEGSVDNGTVNNLTQPFLNSASIKQGKTLLTSWNAATSQLPDLNTKDAILHYFGTASSTNKLFILASKNEGLWYFYRLQGMDIGWARIPLINDNSSTATDTLSANKIQGLVNNAYQGPEIPSAEENKVLCGTDDDSVKYIRSSSLFSSTSESTGINSIEDSTFDLLDVIGSKYTDTKTKTAGTALIVNTQQVAEDINSCGVGLELSDDGDDSDGNMILGVTFVKSNGNKTKQTISIRGGSQPLPPMDNTTVVYGWTNNDTPTESDIRFALDADQTDFTTRTDNVSANALATTTFTAKRTGTEFKNFYVAHISGFFDPEPYALDSGLGPDDTVKIDNLNYDGKVGRSYMFANADGEPIENDETTLPVKLVQG